MLLGYYLNTIIGSNLIKLFFNNILKNLYNYSHIQHLLSIVYIILYLIENIGSKFILYSVHVFLL